MKKKLIVVLGGVTSGVGKGIVTASVASLLLESGINATVAKFDGLLNRDFEQMNPYHKIPDVCWDNEEITVLNDGSIVDSDLGVYERFTGLKLSGKNNIVNGDCWKELLEMQDNENRKFGEVLSIYPHLYEIYKRRIFACFEGFDCCVMEIGGTVGDFESEHFIRALGLMSMELELFTIQVSYIPMTNSENMEETTNINQNIILKPAKQNFNISMQMGLKPDVLVLRTTNLLGNNIKERVSKAVGISSENILFDYNVKSVYQVPAILKRQNLLNLIAERYNVRLISEQKNQLEEYVQTLERLDKTREKTRVLIVGDTESWDSYVTLLEAVYSAGAYCGILVECKWVKKKSEYFEVESRISEYDAFIMTEGTENLCEKKALLRKLHEQDSNLLCISYAACLLAEMLLLNVVYTKDLIVGARTTILEGKSTAISERHRRNFRILFCEECQQITVLGCNERKEEIHIFSCKDRTQCKGVVFHPEYNSRPNEPNMIIVELLKASLIRKNT